MLPTELSQVQICALESELPVMGTHCDLRLWSRHRQPSFRNPSGGWESAI